MRHYPQFALPGHLRSGTRAGIETSDPLLSDTTLSPLVDAVPVVITLTRQLDRQWQAPSYRLGMDAGGLMIGNVTGHKG